MAQSERPHCHVCDAIQNDPPEREFLRDDLWYAGAAGEQPGWVRFQTLRHGDDWSWGLTTDESARLGPMVRSLSAAIRAATGAERVYIVGFGDNAMHFHMLLMPCYPDTPRDWRGSNLLAHHREIANASEAARVAKAIRAELVAQRA